MKQIVGDLTMYTLLLSLTYDLTQVIVDGPELFEIVVQNSEEKISPIQYEKLLQYIY